MVQDTCEPNIISWSGDGEMFAIKNMGQFEKKILPLYFDSNKFTSFKRQLHYYGFGKHKQVSLAPFDGNRFSPMNDV